jgi:hypothetical protein
MTRLTARSRARTATRRGSRVVSLVLVLAGGLAAATLSAQRGWIMEGPSVPPRFRPPGYHDVGFTHCKVMYRSVRREANGMGWSTDYPFAGINLLTRVKELTRTRISTDVDGEPNYWVVRLTDDALFQCPFTMATDVGTLAFSPEEAARLRAYLLKGGFLWVDDFWGSRAWQQWSDQMLQVLPEYRIVDVPPDHPIRHTMFNVETIPQVTSINWWRRNGGETSERGPDSPTANFRMIADQAGRIMVLMTHNTDIGDSWEREGEDREFFLQFSPEGYALGINVVLYGLTH